MQFSSEEEFEEMGEEGESKWKRQDNQQDDSQQAAMAMMELGSGGFYATQGQISDVKGTSF